MHMMNDEYVIMDHVSCIIILPFPFPLLFFFLFFFSEVKERYPLIPSPYLSCWGGHSIYLAFGPVRTKQITASDWKQKKARLNIGMDIPSTHPRPP